MSRIPTDSSRANEQLRLASTIDLVNLLWRRRLGIASGLLVMALVGALYYLLVPPEYLSQAQVLLVPKNPEVVTGDANYATGFDEFVATNRALIVSPLLVSRAIKMSDLTRLPTFAEYDPEWDLSWVVIENLTVSSGPRDLGDSADSIMTVAFQGPVEEDCPIIVQAVLDSYMSFLDELHQDMSFETMQLIGQARELLENDLKKQEDAYIQFREDSPLVTQGTSEVNPLQDRLVAIESERTQLLIRRTDIEGQLAAIRDGEAQKLGDGELLALVTDLRNRPDASDGASNLSTALDGQILQLADREKELLEHYGPNHPKVLTVRQRIDAARRLMAVPSAVHVQGVDSSDHGDMTDEEVVSIYKQSLQQELERIKMSEQLLTELYQSEHEVAKDLSGYQLRDEGYRRSIDRTQQLYDGIVNRLQEANLAKDYGGFEARIIAEPAWAERVVPSLMVTLAGILVGGSCLGFVIALFGEMRDKGFHSRDEIQAKLRIPVVGEIPEIHPTSHAEQDASTLGAKIDSVLCSYLQPRSPQGESIRRLRNALMLRQTPKAMRLVQLTSPSPGDGKSTVTANLAISLAQVGNQVLVIDADLHQPNQHRLFGIEPGWGLNQVIHHDSDLSKAIVPTRIDGLSILPAGTPPIDFGEPFSSKGFSNILRQLQSQFDYVLIDSGPLLAISDPSLIAVKVDGVLLVVKPDKSSRTRTMRAQQLLESVGVQPLGVVVNRLGAAGTRQYQFSKPTEYPVRTTVDVKQPQELVG